MAGIQTPEEAARLKELEDSLDFLKERKMAEEAKIARENAPMVNTPVESDPQNPLLASPKPVKNEEPAIPAQEVQAQPVKLQEEHKVQPEQTEQTEQPEPAPVQTSDVVEHKEEEAPKPVQKVVEMSALDRARASRFAPPRHILEQAGGIKPIDNNSDGEKAKVPGQDNKQDESQRNRTSNSRGGVAPAITPPKEVARPQTLVAAPKPLSPKPVSPQPALKPAMTVEEAQRQGIIAPGTYGKKEEGKDGVIKGDTREIPNIGEITDIASAAVSKEEPKESKLSEPIKNPLPIPKKHESKDMDYDHHINNLDMHFDVVDMSGIDFFDIN